ncbi:MAG: ATP-dependent DNA helicase RecG [Chloroflexota bacterium]
MPSALETLVKILKLEQNTGYEDKAVIGGLKSFAAHWAAEAHTQAKKPEHHLLIEELVGLLNAYADNGSSDERHEAIKHILGRITGRIPPPAGIAPRAIETPLPPAAPTPPPRPPRRDEPRPQRQDSEPPPKRDQRDRIPPPVVEAAKPAPIDMPVKERDSETERYTNREPASEIEVLDAPRQQPARPSRQSRKRGSRDMRRDADTLRAIKGSVSSVIGVGPKTAETLEQLGVTTVEDLLYLFPRRYDDYTQLLPLSRVRPGQTLTVIGTVRNNVVIKGKRNIDILNVTIDDGTGVLTASFFGQPYLRSKLERGLQVVFSGKTDLFRGQVTMSNPEWELLEREALHTRAIVPVYPLTKGLSAHNMRKFARAAIEQWANQLPDYMPDAVLERTDLPELGWAIQQVHFPTSMETLETARRRLAFDELILLQLGVLRNRREWQAAPCDSIAVDDAWLDSVITTLPYTLTGAQSRAVQAIREDMAKTVPTNRLLQGDVGAGKTVVAALAMAIAVANEHQAALMAPTSILAEQHYRGISRLFEAMPGGDAVNIKLLTGATSAQERADILWGLGEGSIHIVIGTHALLEDTVNFARLGFAVIDEQHRFGVEQRGRLRNKGQNPHLLIMTATPIPRTLALTMYADLDLTILDEMPPGRVPIETKIVYPTERERAYSFIDAQISRGRQAFIVYPLVEASENETLSEVRSAVEEFERLQNEVFAKYRLGLLHGRMTPAEKDTMMNAFSQGETQVLVATSVIEVGIDVPNASVMLIEGANRFGLAQLHQFRGRVGRGDHQSYCLLVADKIDDDNARLNAMEATDDGFKLAEIDWEMRGCGELLGMRQSGGTARLGEYMDPRLVQDAQFEARTLYEEDPDLVLPQHAALRETLHQRYGKHSNADVS